MRVGFIGCGGGSSGNHIPNAAANPSIWISEHCWKNKKRPTA